MNKFICIVILCLLFISCHKSNDKVHMSFEQNGKLIQPTNGTITLDKAAFNMVFNFSKPNYILVNVGYDKDLMFKALKGESLTAQPQFGSGHIIAETYFNTDESIYASNESSSAWIQESDDNHMFNRLELKNESYTGTRIVKNIFNLDTNQNTEIEFIDTPIYLVFVIIAKNEDLKNNVELQRIAVKIEWSENIMNAKETNPLPQFNAIIDNIPQKQTPLIDSTNFNNTTATNILNKQDANSLQLGKMYPNFYTEGYDYKSSTSYKLNFSDNFKSVVYNIVINDQEMETVLANYDLEGQLIDHKVISYDEIAEGVLSSKSRIENDLIFKTNITWIEYKHEDIEMFQVDESGYIMAIGLTDLILSKLHIQKTEVNFDYLSVLEITNVKTLMFIPKIIKENEDESIIDAYVVIVNPQTGEIQSKFIEKNCWYYNSAVKISEIEVNYNPYRITENSETVGLTVRYFGNNPKNPFTSNEFTLLIREDDVLRWVLKDFEIDNSTEENDGDGNGFYNEITRNIEPKADSLTTYYNIEITSLIKNVELIESEEKNIKKEENFEKLIYRNGIYNIE